MRERQSETESVAIDVCLHRNFSPAICLQLEMNGKVYGISAVNDNQII